MVNFNFPNMWLYAFLTCALVAFTNAQTCHELVGQEALDLLSTKRPYNFDPSSDHTYTPEGCEAEKLWYFGRHGTRYPGDEDIEAMQTLLPLLHAEILLAAEDSQLCASTISYFSTWKPNPELNVTKESYLTPQGHYEIASISERFVNRYPRIYPQQFSNSSYLFKFTKSQRTEASARAFTSSIFNNTESVYYPEPLKDDPVLKFYSQCQKWIEEVDENPAGSEQHDLFVKGPEMNSTIGSVSKRLGLRRNVTSNELTIMYTTCAFETAWGNGTLSQWCVVFDLDDLRVMEYAEDLEYFWKDGYGFDINWEQACAPFGDALEFFDHSPRTVQAYFSHSGATLKMFARLSLFNGTDSSLPEIRADNFEQMKHSYEWKTSRIDYMGTNMAFVLYSCQNTKTIGLFTQETPTPFPACDNKPFCPYSEFKSKISEFAEKCDFEEICRV